MDIFKIMVDFFEGDSNVESENALFTALSYDTKLRDEFKDLMLINKKIPTSLSSFEPSDNLTHNIFSNLGLTLITNDEVKPGHHNKKGGHFLGYMVSTVIGALLTLLIIQLLPHNQQEVASKNQDQKRSQSQTATIIPKVESQETPVKTYISKSSVYHPNVKKTNVADNRFKSQNLTTNEAPFVSNVKLNSPTFVSLYKGTDSKITQFLNNDKMNDNFSFRSREPSDFVLEIKGNSFWNFPKPTISPAQYPSFNNMTIAFLYDLSDKVKIGADVSQETFYGEYSGTGSDGLLYHYQQQSNFLTVCGLIRYNPFSFDSFYPFFQLDLGANQGGYVGRGGLGLEYKLYNDVSFVISSNYNRFWFKHQNNWFTTSKAGLNYGMSYRF